MNKPEPQRSRIGHWSALLRLRKTRYAIYFNVKGSYDPATGRYAKYAWPLLFKSREEAEAAIKALPVFLNAGATAARGRITGVHIEAKVMR